METNRKSFRQIREAMGLKSGYVAEKIGCHPSVFCNKEQGAKNWTIKDARILCDLYGVDIREVTDFDKYLIF